MLITEVVYYMAYSNIVVYNCFFAESCQVEMHRGDILHAAVKVRTWVTAGSICSEGEGVYLLNALEGKRKYQS